MIGLDTNVLVRYLTQDDPQQSARANELIDGLTEATPGYVSVLVLAEIHWVLTRSYKVEAQSTIALLQELINAREVVIERSDAVQRAWRRAAEGADFADALICELGVAAGCTATVTFDRRATKSAGMTLLE